MGYAEAPVVRSWKQEQISVLPPSPRKCRAEDQQVYFLLVLGGARV